MQLFQNSFHECNSGFFFEEQLSLTTLEEEKYHFPQLQERAYNTIRSFGTSAHMPAGRYRVIDGELFRVVDYKSNSQLYNLNAI
jgi:hypothetical protein